MRATYPRRKLLRAAAFAPLAALAAACGRSAGADVVVNDGVEIRPVVESYSPEPTQAPAPTPVPEPPFVVEAGERRRTLMAATPYENNLYIFGSGEPGLVVMVLGGVHGNEPGGWLAAERVIDVVRPTAGALLVVPRANRVATGLFERTTDALGDLNRSYPGFDDGLPMERMAAEISRVIDEFHVGLVHDMHESWSFYRDRTTNGTAFLGQTIASNGNEGVELALGVKDDVNAGILARHEEFFVRDFGGQNPAGQPQPDPAGAGAASLPRQVDRPPAGRGTSSLGLGRYHEGLITLLVEMGQQQSIERRTALHVEALKSAMRRKGILA